MHNSLERAAPGHAGFRPVEFLGHRFLRHYILPRLFFLGFTLQTGKKMGLSYREWAEHTDRWIQTRHLASLPLSSASVCARAGVFTAENFAATSTFNTSFRIDLLFIIRTINYWSLHSTFQEALNKILINFYRWNRYLWRTDITWNVNPFGELLLNSNIGISVNEKKEDERKGEKGEEFPRWALHKSSGILVAPLREGIIRRRRVEKQNSRENTRDV